MKPKITKQELAQLNKMNRGAFIEVKFDADALVKSSGNAIKALLQVQETINKLDRRSRFERFYDYMSNLINGGKSIAPSELKSF